MQILDAHLRLDVRLPLPTRSLLNPSHPRHFVHLGRSLPHGIQRDYRVYPGDHHDLYRLRYGRTSMGLDSIGDA